MAATYRVIPHDGQWGVEHDSEIAGPYVTREAAFEAAAATASLALKQGLAVEVTAPPYEPGKSPA